MHPIVHKGRFWKIRRAIAYGLFAPLLRPPAHPGRRLPGGLPRHRDPPLPRLRRHVPPDRQPPPRGVRSRRHRHGLLRRLDVRADVVRVRLPADRLPRVPLPPDRGVPRRRAAEAAEAERGAVERAEARDQGGEVVDLDGRRAADGVDLRRLLQSGGGRCCAGSSPSRSPGRAPSSRSRCSPAPSSSTSAGSATRCARSPARTGACRTCMADQDTILVAYDEKRGDPKVKLKDRIVGVLAGDCIDCRSCVNACPTGTDIRRGLQPECIGTAQCVDACEEVMLQQGKPIGLIKYTSEREQKGGVRRIWRPRNLVYLALLTVAWGTLVVLVLTRGDALVEVVRGGREPYRLLPTGEVANQQRVRITNQLDETQRFTIEVSEPARRQPRRQRLARRRRARRARDGERRHDRAAERLRRRAGARPLPRPLGPRVPEGSRVPPPRPVRRRRGGKP